jgi:hypothetical protein
MNDFPSGASRAKEITISTANTAGYHDMADPECSRQQAIAGQRDEATPVSTSPASGVPSVSGNEADPKGFPTKDYRVRDNRIDVIFAQWRKWGAPKFIIDFNVIEDEKRFPTFPESGNETWYNESRYRARRNSGFFSRWFGLSLLQRALFPFGAAFNAVQSAKVRVNEIDRFMSVGEPSPYLRDMRTLGKIRPRRVG